MANPRKRSRKEYRELLLYELTWSRITELLKEAIIAYDNPEEYA